MSVKDTILGFSFALQKREQTLTELSRRTEVISAGTHQSLLGPHASTLNGFFREKIDGQRSALERQGRAIIQALLECVVRVDDRQVLMAVLPALDGILFGTFDSPLNLPVLSAK